MCIGDRDTPHSDCGHYSDSGHWLTRSIMNKINSLDTKEPVLDLTFSVWKYTHANVDLVHKEGSSGKNINLNSSDLLGFEVFQGVAITKLNM